MIRHTTCMLTLLAGLLAAGAPARADDDDKADRLRAEAKKLMAEARELKEAGEPDRAEKAHRKAKELLTEAEGLGGEEKKPKAIKEEKEPKKEKVEGAAKPIKGDKHDDDDKPVKKDGAPEKHVKGDKPDHDDKPVKKHDPAHHEKGAEPKHPGKVVGFEKAPAKAPPFKAGFFESKKDFGHDGARMEATMMHLAQAAKHLREAGAADVAEHIERQIGQMKQQMSEQPGKGAGHGPELHQVIQELRREVAELREAVREMRSEREKR
jgi:hypothetical protein